MAMFNGVSYSWANFSGFAYAEVWDGFWSNVLAEMDTRARTLGNALVATSATNNVPIGSGPKSLTVEAGKGFVAGMYLVAVDVANAANSMTGQVTAYDPATGLLSLSIPAGGSTGGGTPAGWKIGIGGQTGPAGGVNSFNGRNGTVTPQAADYPPALIGALARGGDTATGAIRGTIVTLADAATITPDFNAANYFTVTLGGNRTLANPSNLAAAQGGSIFIVQDGTGSRTLSFASYWKFAGGSAPVLSTAAGAVDRLDYLSRSTTNIHASITRGVA